MLACALSAFSPRAPIGGGLVALLALVADAVPPRAGEPNRSTPSRAAFIRAEPNVEGSKRAAVPANAGAECEAALSLRAAMPGAAAPAAWSDMLAISGLDACRLSFAGDALCALNSSIR